MIPFRRLLVEAPRRAYLQNLWNCSQPFSSTEGQQEENEKGGVLEDVLETRSPPAKGLAGLRVNEGGNINRADILGTVTELKVG